MISEHEQRLSVLSSDHAFSPPPMPCRQKRPHPVQSQRKRARVPPATSRQPWNIPTTPRCSSGPRGQRLEFWSSLWQLSFSEKQLHRRCGTCCGHDSSPSFRLAEVDETTWTEGYGCLWRTEEVWPLLARNQSYPNWYTKLCLCFLDSFAFSRAAHCIFSEYSSSFCEAKEGHSGLPGVPSLVHQAPATSASLYYVQRETTTR